MLAIDSAAPSWSAPDQTGTEHSSEALKGTWYVLYFYPKDDTPGCTIEACGFRDAYAGLSPKITILGVSKDTADSHTQFITKYKLPFPLLVDEERILHTAFLVGADFPSRTTFLIDPEGMIRRIYHGFDCNDHAGDIARDLETLDVKA